MENPVARELSEILQLSIHDIDFNASFINLGGHSISAVLLAAACKRHGIHLTVEAILGSSSISQLLATSKQANPPCIRPDHLSLLPADHEVELPTSASSSTGANAYPITEMQLSLIHGSERQPGKNIISHYETFRLDDLPTMKRAWRAVVSAESIFRTTFDLQGNECRQVEQDTSSFCWEELVVHSKEDYENELREECLDMQTGTSFKVVTWKKDPHQESQSTIRWVTHHSLIDGYSAALILAKVRQATAGISPRPSPPFGSMAAELCRLRRASSTKGRAFWQNRLQKFPSAAGDLLLPSPASPPSGRLTDAVIIPLDSKLERLSSYAQSTGVTVASLYHAAWALVLSVYTDSDTVVYGAVLSGRNLPLSQVENTVGPLVNTLPFHVGADRSQSTAAFLRHVYADMVELASYQWTTPEDGYQRQFSSALAMQISVPASHRDAVIPIEKPFTKISTDIPISVMVEADGTIQLLYDCHRYKKSDVEKLGTYYRAAILGLISPHATLGTCLDAMFSCEALQDLRIKGNCLSGLTTATSIKDDLVSLFEQAAKQNPDAIAIERSDVSLTYRQLDSASSQLATNIQKLINTGDVVCVHSDGSVNWIIGIYGILKAGGVYCPLDMALPSKLRNMMYQSAGSKLFLTPSISNLILKPSSCEVALAVEAVLNEPALQTLVQEPRGLPTPWANAYLCFTSGSTGKPKGVICSHEGLVAFQRDLEVRLFAQPGVKVSQLMSVAFDGSIHEIFSALSYGATLVLRSHADPFAHLKLVDSVILTPSIAQILDPQDFPKIQNVYLVGEPVPQAVADRWGADKKLYNMYGPTEATCGATIKRLLPAHPITIGPPNPSTRIYILGGRQNLVPAGMIGEIYLAGVQVARGYIGMEKETRERFLPDSITRGLGERMYRTGDRGYWNETGEVVLLGRNDRQIKLRGFRLDLNDLEIRMAKAVPSAAAVAIARKDDTLIALVRPSRLDVTKFRSEVAKILPAHALPKRVYAVDSFPMTKAGKLDYAAIAKYSGPDKDLGPGEETTQIEKKVAMAWREILDLDSEVPIDGHSNFVDLGGHSVNQLLLGSRLSTYFRAHIPLRLIIESATLRDMANAVEERLGEKAANIQPQMALNKSDLTSIEREWWQKYELDESTSAFNVSFACNFSKGIDRSLLTKAWNMVLSTHRIFSSRYVKCRKNGVKRIYSEYPPRAHRVKCIDFWKEINRPFELDREAPIRVSLSKDEMVVTVSHITCDLTTLRLLLQDVASVYNGSSSAIVRKSYMECTLWNRVAPPCDLKFWSTYLENLPDRRHLGADGRGRAGYRGSSVVTRIPPNLYHSILNFTSTHTISLHQLALAAVALCLQTDYDDTDVVIISPFLNRPSDDDLNTIGLFLEPLPIRVKYDRHSSCEHESNLESYLQSVRNSSQAALSHAIPWNQLLDILQITPDFPNHPISDVVVTFHDERQPRQDSFPIQGVEALYAWAEGSKFKLMCEFMVISEDSLILRLEHDTDFFSPSSILRVELLIRRALEYLVGDVPYVELKAKLRTFAEEQVIVKPTQENLFCKALKDF